MKAITYWLIYIDIFLTIFRFIIDYQITTLYFTYRFNIYVAIHNAQFTITAKILAIFLNYDEELFLQYMFSNKTI